MTVHFGGKRGKEIRRNYMDLSGCGTDGERHSLFDQINERTASYTFSHSDGLLFATEFAQPALTVNSLAQFADLSARGLVPSQASFAGHSLGEYAALATLGEVFTVEQLVATTWFRGLSMRNIVQLDAQGRSPYAMVAINPSKVKPGFTESHLHSVVEATARCTAELIEVVNYNVSQMQYVCAGSRTALSFLTEALRTWNTDSTDDDIAKLWHAHKASHCGASYVQLKRTEYAVPLRGVDVPFHSSFLRSEIEDYRDFLLRTLKKDEMKLEKLIGRWVPNLTGQVFGASTQDIKHVYHLTSSPVLGSLLGRHDVSSS